MSVVRDTAALLIDRHVMKQTEQKQTESDSNKHQREARASNEAGVVGMALRCYPASYPRRRIIIATTRLG
jgi:hypothetical protein